MGPQVTVALFDKNHIHMCAGEAVTLHHICSGLIVGVSCCLLVSLTLNKYEVTNKDMYILIVPLIIVWNYELTVQVFSNAPFVMLDFALN